MRNASLIAAYLLAGCFDENQAATLFQGTYPGESSYAATITGNGDGLAGAAPLTAIADGDLTLDLGSGCMLAFDDVMLATDSRGRGTSATAMLAGAGCSVPVDGGTATFNVTSGSSTSTGGTSLAVSIGGELTSWVGAPATGFITVMFQGAWAHD
jgi:hypothetical protein